MDNSYFINEMKTLLKEDFPRFEATLDQPMAKALRVNPLKSQVETIASEINLGEVSPFDANTYYIEEEGKLGKHPFHLAGAYYLQDPSATMAVNALAIQQGDWVLDLCAAPGGKSTQILSALQNTGFLWSNEYDHQRAQTLLSNLERWGADNFLISNAPPGKLCPLLEGLFDKVLVDAPCSGASMFKRYPQSVKDYHEAAVLACAKRQGEILDEAYRCLKQEGILVYSTCTYNLIENEQCVEAFLTRHPDMELLDSGLMCGQKGFDEKGYCRRVFPYQGGEGHFACRMVRHSAPQRARLSSQSTSHHPAVDDFFRKNCLEAVPYTILHDKVYYSPIPQITAKVSILRQGILLGEIMKDRFEPSHHFFVSLLGQRIFRQKYSLTPQQAAVFFSGNVLNIPDVRGYVMLLYQGLSIGFGKGDGQQIKNKFPKGLRFDG